MDMDFNITVLSEMKQDTELLRPEISGHIDRQGTDQSVLQAEGLAVKSSLIHPCGSAPVRF